MSRDLKCNSRSFRFTDRVLEILESFEGDNINSKFENLVLFCFDKLPEVKKQYALYESKVVDAKQELYELWDRKRFVEGVISKLNYLDVQLGNIVDTVDKEKEK